MEPNGTAKDRRKPTGLAAATLIRWHIPNRPRIISNDGIAEPWVGAGMESEVLLWLKTAKPLSNVSKTSS
ncbi:hypothetical protein SAMN05444373_100615 [Thermoclostridium caenicola]|uniref:Uncharacterized protein n=1 Tax=Thermoclostridium caenicola TaxID=659425 RepID=A0A1M6CXC3_9FIRM|nr:hypothetical protein SAMN05444373_100615 [Thermoclostridium caenicola]